MNYQLLFLIPLITAGAGWMMNHILVWLMFHPQKPRNIAGFRIQGFLPKNQKIISEKLGHLVHGEIISSGVIEKQITHPSNLEKIMPFIENHVDDFLRNRLTKELPMFALFISDKTIEIIKPAFLKEIETLLPEIINQYASRLFSKPAIEKMVRQKVEEIPIQKLELQIRKGLSSEIRYFKITGAISGLIIGIIAVLISWLFA